MAILATIGLLFIAGIALVSLKLADLKKRLERIEAALIAGVPRS